MKTSESPWSIPIRLEDVPETGLHVERSADLPSREAIAKIAKLDSLLRLSIEFDVSRRPGNGLRVVGEVAATVGQTCVVTLDPLENEIVERIDLSFVAPAIGAPASHGESTTVNSEMGDSAETLIDGTIDLGALAVEFLLLGINPYPRKPDAVFAAPSIEDAARGPFSVLADMKKGRRDDG